MDNVIETHLGYISVIGNKLGITNIIFGKKVLCEEKINPQWIEEVKEYLPKIPKF